ncbi:hypothetical protein GCM10011579_045050 [Streptomyces albiflavescens]|uniref:Uncharacterized protein n=1 Tax=Streptomyces albiflavescens TaxID=1623582 RepID=A0A917Y5I7_9ACTN|nr:hypothetical protein GCM10011579_045050 [Streptomyces albiflavescens]
MRLRLSASSDERDGFGNEAMKVLPGVRRLSALRFPWKAHAVRVARSGIAGSGASTGRTGVAHIPVAPGRTKHMKATH